VAFVTRSSALGVRYAVVLGLSLAGITCERGDRDLTNPGASLIFDNATGEANEALTSTVDFRITDDNIARWQEAQQNLDRLPRSAIPTTAGAGATAIDRAIARLRSSARARRAIESAGLSVRDFVLETIALAQANEAAKTGMTTSPTRVLAANVQFLREYQSRGLRARTDQYFPAPLAESPEMQGEMREREQQAAEEMKMQMETEQSDRAAEVESQRAEQELQQRVQRQTDSVVNRDDRQQRRARSDSTRDSLRHPLRDSLRDSVRDTLPRGR
jgi:hypothetical protein